MPIKATQAGRFRIRGLSYKFEGRLECQESLVKHGRRLQDTKEHRLTPTYAYDSSLDLITKDSVPRLSVNLETPTSELFAGECIKARLMLKNSGTTDLTAIHFLANLPSFISLDPLDASSPYAFSTTFHQKTLTTSNELTTNRPISLLSDGQVLKPGASLTRCIVLRGDLLGSHSLSLLFAFCCPSDKALRPSHFSLPFNILPSLEVRPRLQPASEDASSTLLNLDVALFVYLSCASQLTRVADNCT